MYAVNQGVSHNPIKVRLWPGEGKKGCTGNIPGSYWYQRMGGQMVGFVPAPSRYRKKSPHIHRFHTALAGTYLDQCLLLPLGPPPLKQANIVACVSTFSLYMSAARDSPNILTCGISFAFLARLPKIKAIAACRVQSRPV